MTPEGIVAALEQKQRAQESTEAEVAFGHEVCNRAGSLMLQYYPMPRDLLDESGISVSYVGFTGQDSIYRLEVDVHAPNLKDVVDAPEDMVVFKRLRLTVLNTDQQPDFNLVTEIRMRKASVALAQNSGHLLIQFLERAPVYSAPFSKLAEASGEFTEAALYRARLDETERPLSERWENLSAGLDELEQRLNEIKAVAVAEDEWQGRISHDD